VIVELFPLCLVEIKCVAPREIFKLVREMEAKRRERESGDFKSAFLGGAELRLTEAGAVKRNLIQY
jgi:hypothetical protein